MFSLTATVTFAQSAFKATRISNGLLLRSGQKTLRVEFVDLAIVRVRSVPDGDLKSNETDVCIAELLFFLVFDMPQYPVFIGADRMQRNSF